MSPCPTASAGMHASEQTTAACVEALSNEPQSLYMAINSKSDPLRFGIGPQKQVYPQLRGYPHKDGWNRTDKLVIFLTIDAHTPGILRDDNTRSRNKVLY